MCPENHGCFGRIHGSQLRGGTNAGQHIPTPSLPPSHHSLPQRRGRPRESPPHNVCGHVGLDTNQGLRHAPGATSWWCTIDAGIMLCHNFLMHACALRTTCVLGGYRAAEQRMQGNTRLHSRYLVLGTPSHHCLNGEVYRGNRHHNVCVHVGLDTNQGLHHAPDTTRGP
jgi:hypothetical protein